MRKILLIALPLFLICSFIGIYYLWTTIPVPLPHIWVWVGVTWVQFSETWTVWTGTIQYTETLMSPWEDPTLWIRLQHPSNWKVNNTLVFTGGASVLFEDTIGWALFIEKKDRMIASGSGIYDWYEHDYTGKTYSGLTSEEIILFHWLEAVMLTQTQWWYTQYTMFIRWIWTELISFRYLINDNESTQVRNFSQILRSLDVLGQEYGILDFSDTASPEWSHRWTLWVPQIPLLAWDYEIITTLRMKMHWWPDMEEFIRKVLVTHDEIWATKGNQKIHFFLHEKAIVNPNGPRSYPYMELRGGFTRIGTENQTPLATSFAIPLLWDRIIEMSPLRSGNFVNNQINLISIKTASGAEIYEYIISLSKEYEG